MSERNNKPGKPVTGAKNVYAAIDLGTNNCRMLIAQPTNEGFEVIDGYSKIVRLGEGISTHKRLSPEAMGRTLNALRMCAAKIKARQVSDMRCIATEACRQADNGAEFLDRVRDDTGLSFEIASPKTEAELTLQGCTPLFAPDKLHTLLFDIGGGSTEVVWAETRPGAAPRLMGVLSIPLGVVTLAETFGSGRPSEPTFERIRDEIITVLAPFCIEHDIAKAIDADQVQMIGTSGTVTTLGALSLALERYNRKQVDGLEIHFDTLHQLIDQIKNMDMAERRAIPCIGSDRADLMIMGCAILDAVCKKWPVGKLRAADRGIREGLLMDMMERDTNNEPLTGRSSACATEAAYAD